MSERRFPSKKSRPATDRAATTRRATSGRTATRTPTRQASPLIDRMAKMRAGQGAVDFGRSQTSNPGVQAAVDAIRSRVMQNLSGKGIYQDDRGSYQIRGMERGDNGLAIRDSAVAAMGGPDWSRIVNEADARLRQGGAPGSMPGGLVKTATSVGGREPQPLGTTMANDIIAQTNARIAGRGQPPDVFPGGPVKTATSVGGVEPGVYPNKDVPRPIPTKTGTSVGGVEPGGTVPQPGLGGVPPISGRVPGAGGPVPSPGLGGTAPTTPYPTDPGIWIDPATKHVTVNPGIYHNGVWTPPNGSPGAGSPVPSPGLGGVPQMGQSSNFQTYQTNTTPAGATVGQAPEPAPINATVTRGGQGVPSPGLGGVPGQAAAPGPITKTGTSVGGVEPVTNVPGAGGPVPSPGLGGTPRAAGRPSTPTVPPGSLPGSTTPSRPGQMPTVFPNGKPFGTPGQPVVSQNMGAQIRQDVAGRVAGIRQQVGQPASQVLTGTAVAAGLGDRIRASIQRGVVGVNDQPGVGASDLGGGLGASIAASVRAQIAQQAQQGLGGPRGLPGMQPGLGGVPTMGGTTPGGMNGMTPYGQTTAGLQGQMATNPYAAPAAASGTPGGTLTPMGGDWTQIDKYNDTLTAAANQNGIPPEILKAIAMIESGGAGDQTPCRDDGSGVLSCGMMQVKGGFHEGKGGCTNSDGDPVCNIYTAAAVLKEGYDGCCAAGDCTWDCAAMHYFPANDPNGTDQGMYLDAMHQHMAEIQASGLGTGGAAPAPTPQGTPVPAPGQQPGTPPPSGMPGIYPDKNVPYPSAGPTINTNPAGSTVGQAPAPGTIPVTVNRGGTTQAPSGPIASTPQEYIPTINDAAQTFNVSPGVLSALIQRTSNWNPNNLGGLGPEAAAATQVDPTHPQQNIYGTAMYLAQLKQQFGSDELALAAYYDGPNKLAANGNVPSPEAQAYAQDIIGMSGQTGAQQPQTVPPDVSQPVGAPGPSGGAPVQFDPAFNPDYEVNSIYPGPKDMEGRVPWEPQNFTYMEAMFPGAAQSAYNKHYGFKDMYPGSNLYCRYAGWNCDMHSGIDVPTADGTSVGSLSSGEVICVKDQAVDNPGVGCNGNYADEGGGTGQISVLEPNGAVTVYGHMSTNSIALGQPVTAGKEIGTSGVAAIGHVHIDVLLPLGPNGEYILVDPNAYYNNTYCQQGYCAY